MKNLPSSPVFLYIHNANIFVYISIHRFFDKSTINIANSLNSIQGKLDYNIKMMIVMENI